MSSINENKPRNSLLKSVINSDEDFEFYPTTNEILEQIKSDIETNTDLSSNPSVLDIGAGDGRSLMFLTEGKKYAIEISKPLLNALDKNIYIVGTDFKRQTLIDKKTSVTFCNPPYSAFEEWVTKIVLESNNGYLYLVIPTRWKKSLVISDAIERRKAKVNVIGSFDFLKADRPARATVDIVRVKLSGGGHCYSGRSKDDPFAVWFNDHFKLNASEAPNNKYDLSKFSKESLKKELGQSLVTGDNLINALEKMYERDLNNIITTYQKLSEICPSLMQEMDIDLKRTREALQLKISSLKDRYWQELFNNLDKITNRLT